MNKAQLPKFKYHPNIYESDIVEFSEGECDCCHKKTEAYIQTMYCVEEVNCICMECVASGAAADKFNGTFIQDADEIDNAEAKEELFKRTPGYISWQGENWQTCCNDYCEYIGTVGTKELEELGLADVFFEADGSFDGYEDAREYLVKDGSFCGYLFRCLHCGKYKMYVDAD